MRNRPPAALAAGKADAQAKIVTTIAVTATGSAFCEIAGLVIAMVMGSSLVWLCACRKRLCELIDKRINRGSDVIMDHSSQPILPLETLRGFEAAARTGSFSAAAERLNITHGAISRQIAKLEAWLGLKLFERGARGVSLTQEGQRLYLRTSEAFALIADTTDRWSEPRGAAVVRLTSIPSISGLWLMPRLSALEAGTMKLRIVLAVDNRQNDLADEGIDLSIRCGRGKIPGRISVQLFEEHCFPVASPALAAGNRQGQPRALS